MTRSHTLAFISERFLFVVALVSAIVLILSAGALVTTQYRVRLLFVEIERANDMARKLADDSSQLALDLSKAAQPSRAAPVKWALSPLTSPTRSCLKSSRRCCSRNTWRCANDAFCIL